LLVVELVVMMVLPETLLVGVVQGDYIMLVLLHYLLLLVFIQFLLVLVALWEYLVKEFKEHHLHLMV